MKSPNLGKTPRRGEIWWVSLDPTVGSEIKKTRPCVVITSDILNERRLTVVVVPLSTSARAAPPVMVYLKCGGRPAVAVVDQVRAVSRQRMLRRIESLSNGYLAAVESALREVFELD
jgi:mRNA interferase MazF